MQKNEVGTLSHNIYKNYSKWVIDLSVRVKTKTLSRITGGNLHDLGLSNDNKSTATKQKLNDLDFVRILNIVHQRTLSKKSKTTHRIREEIANYIFNKDLVFSSYNSTTTKINNPIKNRKKHATKVEAYVDTLCLLMQPTNLKTKNNQNCQEIKL